MLIDLLALLASNGSFKQGNRIWGSYVYTYAHVSEIIYAGQQQSWITYFIMAEIFYPMANKD